MQLVGSLSLTALALATSSKSAELPDCISQPWELQNLTMYQAAASSDSGSSISFYFNDPNFNITHVACGTSLAYGYDTYANSLSILGWLACDDKDLGITYQVTSYYLELRRSSVNCANATYTIDGAVSLDSMFDSAACSPPSDGAMCTASRPITLYQSSMTKVDPKSLLPASSSSLEPSISFPSPSSKPLPHLNTSASPLSTSLPTRNASPPPLSTSLPPKTSAACHIVAMRQRCAAQAALFLTFVVVSTALFAFLF